MLHTALCNRGGQPVIVNGEDVMPGIEAGLKMLKYFSEQVRKGKRSVSEISRNIERESSEYDVSTLGFIELVKQHLDEVRPKT